MSTAPFIEHSARAEHNGTVAAEPYRRMSLADLGELPPLSWLVRDVLRARGTNVIYGPSGVGKSCAALDLALCVATGKPWWQGRTGDSGPVLYWAAEGAYGIRRRVLAWCEHHRQAEPGPERMLWTPDSANLLDAGAFARARATVAAIEPKPVLLVFDTLSRLAAGANENAAQDMSAFIHAIDQLRAEADDAASLVIHHTGKDGLTYRGSGTLEAGADMFLALKPRDAGMLLSVDKAKDSPEAGPWMLRLEPAGESTVTVPDSSGSGIGPVEVLTVRALSDDFQPGEEVSTSRLKDACGISDKPGGKPSASSYYRALKRIVELGLATRREVDGNANATFYTLTDAGQQAALSGTVNALSTDGDSTVSQPASLKGARHDSSRGSGSERDQETLL
jgi:hypothetical protein